MDKLVDKQEEMNITLSKNTESLIIHENRTTLAEGRLNMLERKILYVDAGIKIITIVAASALFIKKMLA